MSGQNNRIAFWLGFTPGALSCAVAMAYVQFSSFGHIILCTWADACDGGYVWLGYRVAFAVFLLLDFPVAWAWSIVPGTMSPIWYHFVMANAVALSAGWWALIVALGSRLHLWDSRRRVAVVFVVVYLAVCSSAIYLARLFEFYAEAIHG